MKLQRKKAGFLYFDTTPKPILIVFGVFACTVMFRVQPQRIIVEKKLITFV